MSPADTFAVLKSLGGVLAGFVANGRTVKLDGVEDPTNSDGNSDENPLGGSETAAKGWKCFKDHVDKNAEIYAIQITHSHVDCK